MVCFFMLKNSLEVCKIMQINERKFDFYYGSEADQFSFYRIPKILFIDAKFSKVSVEAKVLYGLLLDRMSLSIKNGWIDDENRVYIYFKLEDAMEFMGIGKDKGVRLFSELDSEKGCGLIVKKRQGLGKPIKIYVMNFNSEREYQFDDAEDFKASKSFENKTLETEVLTSEKPKSELLERQNTRLLKNRSLDFAISDTNNTEINNKEINKTENNNINQIISKPKEPDYDISAVRDEMDRMKKIIHNNIDYEMLCQNYSGETIKGIVDIMVEAICSNKNFIPINSQLVARFFVEEKFLKLNYMHIEYVLECLRKNTTKIRNIKNYILTSLYNAPATIEHYYTAEVNYDLYGN